MKENANQSMKTYVVNLFPLLFEHVDERIINKYDAEPGVIDTKDAIESFLTSIEDDEQYTLVFYNTAIAIDDEMLRQFPFYDHIKTMCEHATRIVVSRVNKRFVGNECVARVKTLATNIEIADDRLKRIAIVVPTYERVETETLSSIYNLIVPDGYECELFFIKGYTCAVARNNAVKALLSAGPFEYTFWVDSDIIVPVNTLQVLIRANADIATAWYVKKIENPAGGTNITELYGPDKLQQRALVNINENELPKSGVVRILACGFGATLVRGDVYTRLVSDYEIDGRKIGKQCEPGDWFHYTFNPDAVCSEDIDFCIKCRNQGMSIVCDTSMRCQHIGRHVF